MVARTLVPDWRADDTPAPAPAASLVAISDILARASDAIAEAAADVEAGIMPSATGRARARAYICVVLGAWNGQPPD